MAAKPLPDQPLLLKLLRYEPESGRLFWKPRAANMFGRETDRATPAGRAKIWNGKHAGKEACAADPNGYQRVRILGVQYLAHRVVWKMTVGEDPNQIDHINGNPADNRFCNLRNVSHSENSRNVRLSVKNVSGCHGVMWQSRDEKWRVRIMVCGREIGLGFYRNLDDAIRVRKAAERKLGFHPNHGRRPFSISSKRK